MKIQLLRTNRDGTFAMNELLIEPEVFDVSKSAFMAYTQYGYEIPWIYFFAILEKQVIGFCGFRGKPVDNQLEIECQTFKKFKGNGYSKSMLTELLRIKQHYDPTNCYSIKIKQNGLVNPEISQIIQNMNNSDKLKQAEWL